MDEKRVVERKYTDEELKKIACDLHSGHIFSDRHCSEHDEIGLIFTPLNFMSKEALGKIEEDKIVFIYEYLDKAGPRSCNGKPMFFSMRLMNSDDFEVMQRYYQKLCDAVKNL